MRFMPKCIKIYCIVLNIGAFFFNSLKLGSCMFRFSVFLQFSCVIICSSELIPRILFVILNHFTKLFYLFFSSLFNCWFKMCFLSFHFSSFHNDFLSISPFQQRQEQHNQFSFGVSAILNLHFWERLIILSKVVLIRSLYLQFYFSHSWIVNKNATIFKNN